METKKLVIEDYKPTIKFLRENGFKRRQVEKRIFYVNTGGLFQVWYRKEGNTFEMILGNETFSIRSDYDLVTFLHVIKAKIRFKK